MATFEIHRRHGNEFRLNLLWTRFRWNWPSPTIILTHSSIAKLNALRCTPRVLLQMHLHSTRCTPSPSRHLQLIIFPFIRPPVQTVTRVRISFNVAIDSPPIISYRLSPRDQHTPAQPIPAQAISSQPRPAQPNPPPRPATQHRLSLVAHSRLTLVTFASPFNRRSTDAPVVDPPFHDNSYHQHFAMQ